MVVGCTLIFLKPLLQKGLTNIQPTTPQPTINLKL